MIRHAGFFAFNNRCSRRAASDVIRRAVVPQTSLNLVSTFRQRQDLSGLIGEIEFECAIAFRTLVHGHVLAMIALDVELMS